MKKRGWKSIDEVDCCENAVTPINNWNILLNSQGSCNTQNMLMFPLHNKILLWNGNTTMSAYDTMSLKEISHLEFNTIVSPKDFNRLVKLSFDHDIIWLLNVQIVCKTPMKIRPPIYKLPTQAYNQTIYVRNMIIS